MGDLEDGQVNHPSVVKGVKQIGNSLSGTGTVHLNASIYTASMKGRDVRSANVGNLSVPTIASSSSRAFCSVSGCCIIASMKLVIVVKV